MRGALAACLVAMAPAIASAQHQEHQHPPASSAPPRTPPAGEHAHQPPTSVRPLSDADRAAAFPDVGGHAVHDEAIYAYVLVDQLEWAAGRGSDGPGWDLRGWVGGDRDRLWFRSEGAASGGRLDTGSVHLLYGRPISPWWDVVGGVRQDVRPGPAQTWAAAGIQGLAPYWIHVEATGYLGAEGRTALRLEAEHDLLVTNRLVLQPHVELDIAGRDDPEREIAAGLSSLDAGLRLRYELRREVAPYVGVTWHRTFLGTADLARAQGRPAGSARLVAGLRFWR
jgi:copper resistance protein B